MSIRHASRDQHLCRKLPGVNTGRVCDKCDGRCVICDSYANSERIVRVCDDCSLGPGGDRCVMCMATRVTADAYYCRECVMLEKDRDGCPRAMVGAIHAKRFQRPGSAFSGSGAA